MENHKPLSKAIKRFYGIGDMTFTLASSVQDYYFNFFLTNIAMYSLSITTAIMSITAIIDAATSWIMGAVINGTKPLKWGRYRSWLILTPWIIPFIYPLKFVVFENQNLSVISVTFFGTLAMLVWNFHYTANIGLVAQAGKTPKDRVSLSSTKAMYNRAAGLLFSFLGLPFAQLLGRFVGEKYQFAVLSFILACSAALGYYVHFRLFDGYDEMPSDVSTDKKVNKEKQTNLGEMLKATFTNIPLLSLIIAEIGRWMINFIVAGTAVYYFKYVAQNVALQATYLIVINVICIIGAYAVRLIAAKLTNRWTFILSYFMMGIGLVVAKLVFLNPYAVIGLMIFVQFFYGCVYTIANAMFADTAIYSEWKTGKNATAFIMGLSVIPLKIALIARGIVINGILASSGFNAAIPVEQTTLAVKSGIGNAFLLVPGAVVILGGIIMLIFYNLSKEKVEEMSAEIAKRRSATV